VPGSFVGREGELAALLDLAQGLMGGTGPVAAVVHGDPGSGKSRLLAEACSRITLDEQILLAGYEPEARVPLAMDRGLLRRLAGVPGPGGSVEALLFAPTLEAGPVEPVRLFEAAHRALAALGPTLIAVDDVQWVDEVSLGLLHYLIRAAEMGASRWPRWPSRVCPRPLDPLQVPSAGSSWSPTGSCRLNDVPWTGRPASGWPSC
jgi:hypothetical protein